MTGAQRAQAEKVINAVATAAGAAPTRVKLANAHFGGLRLDITIILPKPE